MTLETSIVVRLNYENPLWINNSLNIHTAQIHEKKKEKKTNRDPNTMNGGPAPGVHTTEQHVENDHFY